MRLLRPDLPRPRDPAQGRFLQGASLVSSATCPRAPWHFGVRLAGSRGASWPRPSPSPHRGVCPPPTAPTTLAHWTVSTRRARTGLCLLPCPRPSTGPSEGRCSMNERTILSPSGKGDRPPASVAGVPQAGARTWGERDPQASLSTAGLGSHSPGIRPHFAPPWPYDLGQVASPLRALAPSYVKLRSAHRTVTYSHCRYLEPARAWPRLGPGHQCGTSPTRPAEPARTERGRA